MQRRCPKCRYIKKYVLDNYQLAFRNGGWADIEKKIGKKVYGALYLISKCSEKRLDKYEDYPVLYKKIYFKFIYNLQNNFISFNINDSLFIISFINWSKLRKQNST